LFQISRTDKTLCWTLRDLDHWEDGLECWSSNCVNPEFYDHWNTFKMFCDQLNAYHCEMTRSIADRQYFWFSWINNCHSSVSEFSRSGFTFFDSIERIEWMTLSSGLSFIIQLHSGLWHNSHLFVNSLFSICHVFISGKSLEFESEKLLEWSSRRGWCVDCWWFSNDDILKMISGNEFDIDSTVIKMVPKCTRSHV
jgi:hypothetical protein